MGYIVNQYNKDRNINDFEFMTPFNGGNAVRIKESIDIGVISAHTVDPFENEAVELLQAVEPGKYYYFHSQIKRLDNSDQTFYLYLVNKNENDVSSQTQFLKMITIQKGNGWVDLEFIFTPYKSFNHILFQLERTAIDYEESTCRYPIIIYQELSEINNLLTTLESQSLYKIGIQSRPGFLMCINGEEIRTGRSGIYELKNGFISVNFFSAVAAANPTKDVESAIKGLTSMVADKNTIQSQCLFSSNVERIIDNFSLDYIYEQGGTV